MIFYDKLKSILKKSNDKYKYDITTIALKDGNYMNATQYSKANNSTIYKPTTFAQVEEIANVILNHTGVIVDLTTTNLDIAKRICDFLNGVTYALNGEVVKIAKLVYLFSPK